jgi:hypothetical protein
VFSNEHQIAQAEFRLYEAKFNRTSELEGTSISVPNVVDRMLMALRKALPRRNTQGIQRYQECYAQSLTELNIDC